MKKSERNQFTLRKFQLSTSASSYLVAYFAERGRRTKPKPSVRHGEPADLDKACTALEKHLPRSGSLFSTS